MKVRIIGGFQNTKTNGEDFALTPYVFSVWVSGDIIKVYGIGICWGHWGTYIGIGVNLPKKYPTFIIRRWHGVTDKKLYAKQEAIEFGKWLSENYQQKWFNGINGWINPLDNRYEVNRKFRTTEELYKIHKDEGI